MKADIEIEIKSGVDTKSESTPTEDTELLSMEDLQRLHHKKNDTLSSLTSEIRDELIFLEGARKTLEHTSAGGDVAFGVGVFGLISDIFFIGKSGTATATGGGYIEHKGRIYTSTHFGRRIFFRLTYILAFIIAMFNTDKDEAAEKGAFYIYDVEKMDFPGVSLSEEDRSLDDEALEARLKEKIKNADETIDKAKRVLTSLRSFSRDICECRRPYVTETYK